MAEMNDKTSPEKAEFTKVLEKYNTTLRVFAAKAQAVNQSLAHRRASFTTTETGLFFHELSEKIKEKSPTHPNTENIPTPASPQKPPKPKPK